MSLFVFIFLVVQSVFLANSAVAIAFVAVTNTRENQSEEGRLCAGSQFQWCQSTVTEPVVWEPVVRQKVIKENTQWMEQSSSPCGREEIERAWEKGT